MSNFKNKNDNLDRLLSKFYSAKQAEEMKKDFADADEFFEKFSAPKPSEQTIMEIKNKISAGLLTQKHITWPAILVKTAAVAVILITAAVLINIRNKPTNNQIAETRPDIEKIQLIDETDISVFETELQLLRSELLAINYGETNGTNGSLSDSVEDAELEIIETDNTFWKG
jgi:hypothetical protein